MKNTFLFLLTVIITSGIYGQHKDYTLEWENRKNLSSEENSVLYVPGFSNEHFDFLIGEEKILFSAQWKEMGNIASYNLTQVVYEPIQKRYLTNLNLDNIPSQPEADLKSSRGRDNNYIILQLSPIIKEGNTYKKITSFRIEYELTNRRTLEDTDNTPSETNSVLSSGNFYQFQVDQTGVFKIDASFLSSLGMDVSSIDPRNIKIYSHGGEMLPLKNSDNYHYDPPQIPIRVIGEADGSFDSDDYILFYGIGTKGNWNEESETNLNLYADHSYYYITADGQNGERIGPHTAPSGSANLNITTFDDRDYYEVDETNIGKVGRTWFGDQFDVRNERTYDFNFPNIVSGSELKFEIHAAAASETNTSLSVEVNGTAVGSLNFGSLSTDIFARHDNLNFSLPANSDDVQVKLKYNNNGNPASIGYLDYINVFAERKLIAGDKQFIFSNKDTGTQSGIGSYHIQNSANISEVWDITNPYEISRIANQTESNNLSFKAELGEIKKYIAISDLDYYTPTKPRQTNLSNVNLKGTVFRGPNGEFQDVDYIIVTSENFSNQASRIANLRKNLDGLNTKIVLDTDIYKEFSSGKQDISAIRNFVKYVYNNASSPDKRLKYILLLGNASIDYKDRLPDNNNIIPTFESKYSYSLRHDSAASDDFFGMMDPEEGRMANSEKLDIAVGRIPADNPQMAKNMVDKIIEYADQQSYGPWRNNFVLISDDADDASSGGAGLQFSLDALGDEISENKPFINVKKIHSDSYEQIYTSGGQRYPEVNKAISDNIEVGAMVVNYFGHGGEEGLASEFIVTREDIKGWRNRNRYNVFVTVTCEFTR
ncbi:MAG TPA: type IX secretion system sortase PorU, partial [Flavobacteriaceae bacterium]|nr:type IX secretion system sortase PorU [Flavobacteriaceae bacterium]